METITVVRYIYTLYNLLVLNVGNGWVAGEWNYY